jgi:hypothetical protein
MILQIPYSCVNETHTANKQLFNQNTIISFENSMLHEPAIEAIGGNTKPWKQWDTKREACLCVCRRHDSKLPPCRPMSEKVKADM